MSDSPVVLLIEDESMLAISLEAHLSDDGFVVQTIGSGTDGEAAIAQGLEGVVCLVTDIRVGRGKNGWQLARMAREQNPNLPVVYMSGDSAADWAIFGVPNSLMLSKPFALAQLTTAIAQLVNSVPPTV